MMVIPLEVILANLCKTGSYSLADDPILLEFLERGVDRDKLYHIEYTTAAKGTTLWFPMSAWYAEQQRQLEEEARVEAQYAYVKAKLAAQREELIRKIDAAKKRGDLDTIWELRKELKAL